MTLEDELTKVVGFQYDTGKQWRNSSEKNEEAGPKQNDTQLWRLLVVTAKSDAIKNNIS